MPTFSRTIVKSWITRMRECKYGFVLCSRRPEVGISMCDAINTSDGFSMLLELSFAYKKAQWGISIFACEDGSFGGRFSNGIV